MNSIAVHGPGRVTLQQEGTIFAASLLTTHPRGSGKSEESSLFLGRLINFRLKSNPILKHPSNSLLTGLVKQLLHAFARCRRALEIVASSDTFCVPTRLGSSVSFFQVDDARKKLCTYLGRTHTARRIRHVSNRSVRRALLVIFQEALVAQVLLQAQQVHHGIESRRLAEAVARRMMPLSKLALHHIRLERGIPNPLHNRVHGNLVGYVKAQEDGVPRYVRQALYRVEVRHARGVL